MQSSTFDLSNRIFYLVLALIVTLILALGAEAWDSINADDQYDQIAVEGDGKIKMEPDVAYVNLAVSTEKTESAEAIKENTDTVNAVLEAIFALGIAEEDVQTYGYSLYPSYEWINDEYQETGYEVYQALSITVKDFDILSDLIATTGAAGANRFNGVSFELEEYETELETAREEAIAEARSKAEAIAKASGSRLGKLISYYEYNDSGDNYGKGGGEYDTAELSMDEALTMTESSQFQSGQEEITLTVSLSYRIK